MAYKVKYTKTIETQGVRWDLIILQDTEESITPMEIGPVLQGLRLCVQGEQTDIDAPIVKTSLSMFFVDAPDLDVSRKCGYWEEFYTSSSTEYKVMLLKDNVLEWSGYITPDSFEEDLQYRGSISITARDNIGAMQNYEYDALPDRIGMQDIISVVRKGLATASCPLSLQVSGEGSRKVPYTNDSVFTSEAWAILFNNKSLQGKNWYEAVENLLYATGMCLRYVGKNTLMLCSLRDLPLYGYNYNWEVEVKPVEFRAYGHRELAPAVKNVVDEADFNLHDNIADVNVTAEAYGASAEKTYYEYDSEGSLLREYNVPVYMLGNTEWTTPSVNESIFLNPFAYKPKEGRTSQRYGDLNATDVVYILGNNGPLAGRKAIWKNEVGAGKYRFSFQLDTPLSLYDNLTKVGFNNYVAPQWVFYMLTFTSNDGTESYRFNEDTKTWENGTENIPFNSRYFGDNTLPFVVDFPDLEVNSRGFITLEIRDVQMGAYYDDTTEGLGAYVQVKGVKLLDAGMENTAVPTSLKVTTKYSDKNNILLQRKVEYAFNMGQIASPKIVVNGLYIYRNNWYEASDNWVFSESDTPQPLSVLIHQQLLCYYTKPNNILTGELMTPNPDFCSLYEWKGKKHIITSGNLNILTGRMENAVLREFMRYDHLWGLTIEQDTYTIGAGDATLTVQVYGKNKPVAEDVTAPEWLTLVRILGSEDEGVYKLGFNVQRNTTGSERTGILQVGTAAALIRQER